MSSRCWQPAGVLLMMQKVVDGDGGLQESESKFIPGAEGIGESVP